MDEAKIQEAIAKAVEAGRVAGRAEGVAEATRERPGTVPEKKEAEADAKDFSFAKVANSLMAKDKSVAKKEWERSFDDPRCREKYVEQYGEKALTLANDASAGFLVPPQVMRDQLIPYLRVKMVAENLGVQRMSGLTYSPVKIPRQNGIGTAYWVGEATAITAEAAQTLDMISFNPKKAGAYTRTSKTLLRKSPAAAEPFVRSDLMEGIARLIDVAVIQGSGASGQPLGVANISGKTSVSFSGSTDVTKWQLLLDMQKGLEAANVPMDNAKWLMSVNDYYKLAKIQLPQAANGSTPYQGMPLLGNGNVTDLPSRLLFGKPIITTAAISDGTLFFCDWSDVILADWDVMEVSYDEGGSTLRTSDLAQFTVFQEVDVNVRHGASVCVGTSFS